MTVRWTVDLGDFIGEDGEISDREGLQDIFMMMCQDVLPTTGRKREWPIYEDHCFMRVCYDNAYGDEWYDYVDYSPVYKNMDGAGLFRAVSYALGMVTVGVGLVRRLNERSLYWRDKIGLDDMEYADAGRLGEEIDV